jgi:hypothetical protein
VIRFAAHRRSGGVPCYSRWLSGHSSTSVATRRLRRPLMWPPICFTSLLMAANRRQLATAPPAAAPPATGGRPRRRRAPAGFATHAGRAPRRGKLPSCPSSMRAGPQPRQSSPALPVAGLIALTPSTSATSCVLPCTSTRRPSLVAAAPRPVRPDPCPISVPHWPPQLALPRACVGLASHRQPCPGLPAPRRQPRRRWRSAAVAPTVSASYRTARQQKERGESGRWP